MRDNRYDEIRIDPVNLIGHLLIKWKKILSFSVIVAAIVGIVATGIKISRSGEGSGAESSGQSNGAAAGLSQGQIAEAEDIYSRILDYDRMIENQRTINRESYIMSLDPDTAVAYYKLFFLETDIGNTAALYNYILNDNDYEEISKLLGPDIVKRGLSEAVSLWANTTDADSSYAMDLERSSKLTGEIETIKRLVVSEVVYAPDKSSCEGIVEIVEKAIERREKSLEDQGAYVKFSSFDEGYYDFAQSSLFSSQQGKINALVGITNGKPGYVNNMLAAASEPEKVYVNSLRAGGPKAVEGNAEGNYNRTTEITWKSVFIYAIIGLACGFVLSVIWFVLQYLSGGKIRSISELPGYFKIPVLQTLMVEGISAKQDLVTQWGRKASGGDIEAGDHLTMLAEELDDKAGKKGLRQIYVAADNASMGTSELLHKLCEGTSEGVKYVSGSIEPSADELKALLASDGIVLIPVLDCTGRKLIKAFLDICRRNDKNIIGSAPVRDWKVL